jgi:hypothetical protein
MPKIQGFRKTQKPWKKTRKTQKPNQPCLFLEKTRVFAHPGNHPKYFLKISLLLHHKPKKNPRLFGKFKSNLGLTF